MSHFNEYDLIVNMFFHYQNTKDSIGVDLPLWEVLYSWPLHETSVAVKVSEEEEAMVPFVENSA